MFGGLSKQDRQLLLEIKEDIKMIRSQLTTVQRLETEVLDILSTTPVTKNPAVALKFTLGTVVDT
jgi:hypothetical protein